MSEARPRYELAAFSRCVGDVFQLQLESAARPFQLTEAKARRLDGQPENETTFSLLFLDPAASVDAYCNQGIYRLQHDTLGTLELFLVPVGPPRGGRGILYEAIFNQLG